MSIDWTVVLALSTMLSGIAVAASLILLLRQIRQEEREEFVTGTASLFQIWEDDDFQRALQWVLYELKEQTWREFVAAHRGKYGERALTRVGAYFNRIGYIVGYHLLGSDDRILLDTVAGFAIATWRKVEPLVLEARLIENATIFQDFERMLPRCYECYVPNQPLPPEIKSAAEEAAHFSGEQE